MRAKLQGTIASLVGRPVFWLVAVAVLLSIPLGMGLSRKPPDPPPMLGGLPAFSLVDQDGAPFTEGRMRGKVWIAGFIFTRCPTVCPRLTEHMAQLQRRLRHMGGQIQLATFSVDPEYDTPARMADYAQRTHANPRVWTFVTGSLGQMRQAVIDGFKIAMGRDENAPSDVLSIFHGERLVLVDHELNIRGYYEANEQDEDRLIQHAALLAGAGRPLP